MPTTRQNTKRQLDSIITKLKEIEIQAINIGMLYDKSDVTLSGVMLVVSQLVETVIPLLEQANTEL